MTATLLPTGHELVCWHDAAVTPCEPGILARCRVCRLFFAPCTRSEVDVRAVIGRRWVCKWCREETS